MVRWTEMLVSMAHGPHPASRPPGTQGRAASSSTASQRCPGSVRRTASRSHARRASSSSGSVRARSRSSLGRPRRALKCSTISGAQVADPVRGHPGDLLDRRDVPGQPLARPPPVGVRGERQVDDPRRLRVLAHPDLALPVEHLGEPVVQRAQRAAGVAPQVPALPHVLPQRRDVAARIERSTSSCSRAHAGERLDRPAADDPPGPPEARHERRDAGRVERRPRAVAPQERLVLRAPRRGPRSSGSRTGPAGPPALSSSRGRRGARPRARTPRPAPRLSSRVLRPTRLGTSSASKLTRPRATTRPSGPARSTGSPAANVAAHPGDAGASSEARRSTTARTAPASSRIVPFGSVAWASHSSRVGRRRPVRGRACRPARPASARRRVRGGGQHHRDAGAGGDPGRLDLGVHAAGAEPGRAGAADADPVEVGRRGDVGDQGAARQRRVGVVEAVDVGEQHQQVGVHEVGDQRGQPVVVAEADLGRSRPCRSR